MARIRTIKPSMFSSDSVCALPRAARWTLAGLFTYCDDEGRGRFDPRRIKAELYPIDDRMTPARIDAEVRQIAAIEDSPLCLYLVGDASYLHFPKWLMHQRINRPTMSKLPPCPRPHAEFGEAS